MNKKRKRGMRARDENIMYNAIASGRRSVSSLTYYPRMCVKRLLKLQEKSSRVYLVSEPFKSSALNLPKLSFFDSP